MSVVTIRGLMGSGAPEIGLIIADDLHCDYVDREIIGKVAALLNRRGRDVMEKEMPTHSLLERIGEALAHSYAPGPTADGKFIPYLTPIELPLDDSKYLQGLESVIRELARSEPIVICGRGSQFILKDHPRVFHVLTVAPIDTRVKRVMQSSELDAEAAKKKIVGYDNSRSAFIKRFFHADLEDPNHYDIVVNTEHLDFDAAAQVVVAAVPLKGRTADGVE
jgi:hypothetical protein